MKNFMTSVLALTFLLVIFPAVNQAQEEYSGAFQYGGSSPCTGIIGPGDVGQILVQVASGTGNYVGCKPESWNIQDVDGDGVVSPGDIMKIMQWVSGNYDTGESGKPHDLAQVAPGPVEGGSVELCVRLYDDGSIAEEITTPRAGWGVNFMIDPSSTCPGALLEGLDPTPVLGLGKDQTVIETMVFAYTGTMATDAEACVKLYASGCLPGENVVINNYVPDDDEALLVTGSKGRLPDAVLGTDFVIGF